MASKKKVFSIVLLVMAGIVFWIGLGLGLMTSPLAGTIVCLAAAAILMGALRIRR